MKFELGFLNVLNARGPAKGIERIMPDATLMEVLMKNADGVIYNEGLWYNRMW